MPFQYHRLKLTLCFKIKCRHYDKLIALLARPKVSILWFISLTVLVVLVLLSRYWTVLPMLTTFSKTLSTLSLKKPLHNRTAREAIHGNDFQLVSFSFVNIIKMSLIQRIRPFAGRSRKTHDLFEVKTLVLYISSMRVLSRQNCPGSFPYSLWLTTEVYRMVLIRSKFFQHILIALFMD